MLGNLPSGRHSEEKNMNGQRVVMFLVIPFLRVKITRTGRKELVQRSSKNISKYYEIISALKPPHFVFYIGPTYVFLKLIAWVKFVAIFEVKKKKTVGDEPLA